MFRQERRAPSEELSCFYCNQGRISHQKHKLTGFFEASWPDVDEMAILPFPVQKIICLGDHRKSKYRFVQMWWKLISSADLADQLMMGKLSNNYETKRVQERIKYDAAAELM